MKRPEILHKPQPTALRDLCDDLAVEISLEMQRRKMRLKDLRSLLGFSERRTHEVSRYLRGVDHNVGHVCALRVAEALGVPVRILTGDEARQAAA